MGKTHTLSLFGCMAGLKDMSNRAVCWLTSMMNGMRRTGQSLLCRVVLISNQNTYRMATVPLSFALASAQGFLCTAGLIDSNMTSRE